MSYCVDTNVFMTAGYKTYSQKIFPTLYQRMQEKLVGNIILIQPVFDEIEPIDNRKKKDKEKLRETHPLRIWLEEVLRIEETQLDDTVKQKALDLMVKYETDENGKGANEADISLIAFALLKDQTVVTLEAQQNQKPNKRSNYKIPLICQQENVECIDFVELLARFKIVV